MDQISVLCSQAVEKHDIPSNSQAPPFQQNSFLCSPCADTFTPTVGCPDLPTSCLLDSTGRDSITIGSKCFAYGSNLSAGGSTKFHRSFGSDAELALHESSARVCL